MTLIIVSAENRFKSATAESHLLEICTFLQNQERSTIANPTVKDYFQVSYNLNNMTTGITFSLPAEQSIDSSGQVVTSASEYLSGVTFVVGSGGTFKSATLSNYFQEVVSYLQIKEASPTANPQALNNVSTFYDGDNKLFTGTITLPISVNFDSEGHPVILATEYLL